MGSLYTKRKKLWVRYKNELGKWSDAPTPYGPGQETLARRYLIQRERRISAAIETGGEVGAKPGEPLTVAQYAMRWIRARQPLKLATASDDKTRLHKHVLPRLGEMKLEDVRPRHIRDLIIHLRTEPASPGGSTTLPGSPWVCCRSS